MTEKSSGSLSIMENRFSSLKVLYKKEMADHIRSRRFLLVLGLVLLTSFASIYGAIQSIADMKAGTEYLFLQLFTIGNGPVPSFMTFIALLGPFVGITLGFDGINSERTEGTLNRLVTQPMYRDTIINGKFLAGAEIIFLMVLTMGLVIGSAGFLVIGIPPSAEEIGRILCFLLFTGVYICFWLALSIFFSVVCRHAATSAMVSIGIWIFFALFMSMVVQIVADAMFPVTEEATVKTIIDNYNFTLGLNRLSPYYLYSEAVATIMNPSVRTTNIILPMQLSGTIPGTLSLGQSLLLVWPHLVGLFAGTCIVFAASYIKFMRKEIR